MISVAYDVTSLAENPCGGIARVCYHILEQAARSDSVHQTALIRRGNPSNVNIPGTPVRQVKWLDRFRAGDWEIAHALCHHLPGVRSQKLIYTLHDAWSLYPNPYQSPEFQRKVGDRLRRDLEKADVVVTVSQATRNKLLELGIVDPSRCHVVPNGVAQPKAESTRPDPPDTALLPKQFVLFVGRIEVRKNLEHIVEAVLPLTFLKLVLIGDLGFGGKEIVARTLSRLPSDRLVQLQHISEANLDWLYRNALASLQPSWEEGFGLPILEAMVRGCPVITSDCSGSAEVGGAAAITVDPSEPRQSRMALERLTSDPAYCEEHSARGVARAADFTWEISFAELLQIYRQTLC